MFIDAREAAMDAHNSFDIAQLKDRLSSLLNRVTNRHESITITKRGKPIAKLVPIDIDSSHLSNVEGWLDEDDPFFTAIEEIVAHRSSDLVRATQLNEDD
jgi:prevent-host-death family protein